MSEWQSIETAPRDGTVILLAKAGKDAAPGRWVTDNPEFPWQTFEPRTYYDRDPLDGWMEDRPTHWMPLPAPPAQEAQTEPDQRINRIVAHLKQAFGVSDLRDIEVFFGAEEWWRDMIRRMLEAGDAG